MNNHSASVVNLLGALGQYVAGQVRAAVTDQIGSGGMLPDAVIVIKDQPGRTVDWLAHALEMSQPGAVHLAQKLVNLGWVEKRPGTDARSYALHLTPPGRRAADKILSARRRVLEQLVSRLSGEQREQLTGIASALLTPPALDERSLAHLCRLCDRSSCPHCPAYKSYLYTGDGPP